VAQAASLAAAPSPAQRIISSGGRVGTVKKPDINALGQAANQGHYAIYIQAAAWPRSDKMDSSGTRTAHRARPTPPMPKAQPAQMQKGPKSPPSEWWAGGLRECPSGGGSWRRR